MIKKTLELIGEYILLMKRVFTKPEKWSIFWKQYFVETESLGLTFCGFDRHHIHSDRGEVLVIQTAYNIEDILLFPK